jgi:glycogen operon protein
MSAAVLSSPVLLPGRAEPLGAQVRDGGVNFAVFSAHARAIELCLFDAAGQQEWARLPLAGPVDGVWCGFLPQAGPGLVYGLRAHGPHEPQQGHRFNPHKLLLDPYAREIVGRFDWLAEHHGYPLGHADGPLALDTRDNAGPALKARVAAPLPGESPRRNAPRHPGEAVVLYELHVKGFSMQHPDIPAELRGSYAGLAHPAAIAHFKRLGVSTLSLLPVHYALDEPHLQGSGLHNYWGYNTLGFFCPDPRLASTASRDDPSAVAAEFRAMVHALHEAGLELVLDVVYNHTPEGNEWGPTLSLRGLDQASYYRLQPGDAGRLENLSACGNTVNVAHPRVTQLVLDSLRYWVQEMGVDGFRFDLAPVLGRTVAGFDPQAAFFTALRQDPLLAQVHLIAEPWDAGPQGYQLGRFPGRFLEWNDKFRDAARGYWLGHGPDGQPVSRGELAQRLTASSAIFQQGQRSPLASINFLSVHDGFTLHDLCSHSRKHNLANGEDNRDGRDGELCANFGAEGPSDDPAILATRERVRRAMLATLALAQGTPMLCAGDEIANSQGGNNNAYCQDNPIGWLDWARADQGLSDYVAGLLSLRADLPALHQGQWLGAVGSPATLDWRLPDGSEPGEADWLRSGALALRLQQAAQAPLLLLFNPAAWPQTFAAPPAETGRTWRLLLDSSGESAAAPPLSFPLQAPARSVLLCQACD